MTTTSPTYFCSQKFTWLSVNLEKRLSHSCCAATPENIDLKWVSENPGQLFNTPALHKERQQMLENIPVDSCKDNCWKPESQGLLSRRIMMQTDQPQKLSINSTLSKLNIILGSSCNLTCVYCCKQYSSAWYHDIDNNGSYLSDDRFQITTKDRVVSKLSQNEHATSQGFQTLVTEFKNFENLDFVAISGGEPFLYNQLSAIINQFSTRTKIQISTGLGVDTARLQRELDKINDLSNVTIYVSAETTHKLYEFIRYGNSFDKFLRNLKTLKNNGCNIVLRSVLSNTTIFNIVEFAQYFNNYEITYQFCSDPDFLNVNVLDYDTKQQLLNKIKNSNITIKDQLIHAVEQSYTDKQKSDLKYYLSEFASRRKLSLDVFPLTMTNWLQLEQ